jgi:outer membrane protein assembly factor BamB
MVWAVVACSISLAVGALPDSPALASAQRVQPGHHTASPAVPRDSAATSWPEFHGDHRLTGVSSDRTISTANASTLGLQWMTHTGAAAFTSPVTAYDTSLHKTLAFVGNTGGYFEAINTANGSIVWSDAFGVPIDSTPAVFGNDVWTGTFDSGRVYKLDTTTGAIKCSISLGTGTLFSSLAEATPPGGKPTVYFGVQDNGTISTPIMAVDEATCKIDWSSVPYSQESGSWNPTSYGISATGEGLTLAGSANPDSTVYALDAKTGAKVWSNRNRSPAGNDVGAGITISPPGKNGLADGVAYYPGEDGVLYAIDLTTGATVWTFNFLAATTPSPYKGGRSAAALDGRVLVFGTGTGVMAVDAVTGAEIWDSAKTMGPDTEIVSSPLITGPPGQQVVVYGDMNGAIQVLSLATGAPLFSFQTHGYIMASPAGTNGSILIQSSDGFLYSLGLGGTTSTSYPSTAITNPASGATLPNPNSATSQQADITVSGTSTTEHTSPKVLVEIEENGPNGQWWNASTATWQAGPIWNPAAVSGTDWTFKAPVSRAGTVWRVYARAQDSDGEVDPVGAATVVTIKPVTTGPRLTVSSPTASPGSVLTVSGAGFLPSETVQLSLPGTTLATTTATSTGALPSTQVQVPTTTPYGTSALYADGKTSGSAATAALYVTSPWIELGGDPGRSGYLPNDTVLARVVVPDQIYRMRPNVVYDTSAPIRSSPAVASHIAYVGNDAGDLDAVRTTTGALVWKATTGGPIQSSPALDPQKKVVIVGSDDGSVYAFNRQNGKQVWRTPTGGAVESSPAIANGVVYVGSDSGRLYALDEASGAVRWSAPMSGSVISSPAVDSHNGLVVTGDSAGDVTAFAISGPGMGNVLWTHKTGGAVKDTPIVSNGTVYVGSNDGHEYALSERAGTIMWSVPLGGSPSATSALSNKILFVGSSDGTFYALTASNGATLWKASTGAPVTGVSATVDMVFIESSNGTASGFRDAGELVWLAKAGTVLSGTPAISDNAVLIGAGDKGLYVYTPYGLPMI